MSAQNELQNTMASLTSVSETGLIEDESNIPQPKVVIGGTGSTIAATHPHPPRESKSSTLEFRLGNNRETLVDRSSSSRNDTQGTPSSPTSEAESTSSDGHSGGFWTESSMEQSRRLWLPTETALHGLGTTYLSGFSRSMKHASFVIPVTSEAKEKMNSPMTLWPSSPSSLPGSTDVESTGYCRKIRIYPTEIQKKLFEKCFGATRYIHNKALGYIRDNPGCSKSFFDIRKVLRIRDEDVVGTREEWLKEIPYDTRVLALKQLASNFKTNFTLLKRGHIRFFKMHFKKKKSPYQMCFVNKKALDLSSLRIFKTRSKEEFKVRKKLKRWIDENEWTDENKKRVYGDLVLRREKDRYFLCLPLKRPSTPRVQPFEKVALDPGVRTFQTFYSAEGVVGKIGDELKVVLEAIGQQHDNLQSILATKKHKRRTRYNLRKRCFKLRTKLKNIVNDLHWKTAHYLCSTFKHILLPSFNVSRMTVRQGRNIHSKVVRSMLTLSHFAFKEKLQFKAKCLGATLQIVNEAYTTKTCGRCGKLKDMSGLKMYDCPACGVKLDRDINAARNILLKYE